MTSKRPAEPSARGADAAPRGDRLERDSATALYVQIADQLRRDIDAGRFSTDSRLPTENELTQRFGVSRVTVRQAIAQLLAEGYVVTKQGKGTFVARQKFLHDLRPMRGFYDALLAQGVEPKTKLLEFAATTAPAAIAQGFGAPDAPCFQLTRLYLVDDAPIALVSSYLPPAASALSWEQASSHPIYMILERLLGVSVARADIRIRAQAAGPAVGRALGLGARAAVLVMERESFDADGRLGEHTAFYIRPENYEFSLSVQGPLPVSSAIKNVQASPPSPAAGGRRGAPA